MMVTRMTVTATATALVVLAFLGCQTVLADSRDVPVGYVFVEDTSTVPDSLAFPSGPTMERSAVSGNPFAVETSPARVCTCPNCRGRLGGRVKSFMQWTHWGYCSEFVTPSFGTYLNAHLNRQIEKGIQESLTLYQYDFCPGTAPHGARLNEAGRRRLEQWVDQLQTGKFVLIIESAPNMPELDAARRDHVMGILSQIAPEVPRESIVVGRPYRKGLLGEESVDLYQNLLQQTRQGRGNVLGSGTSGGFLGGGAGMGSSGAMAR